MLLTVNVSRSVHVTWQRTITDICIFTAAFKICEPLGIFNDVFFSSNKSFSAFFLSISMVDIIFFSLFPEICSERDHVANRKEGHVHHLVRLVCRVMVPPIRAHQFQWVPMMCTNVRLHHQALKTGITFNTQWCLFNYILILSIDPNF